MLRSTRSPTRARAPPGALADSGGVCVLERMRGRKDAANPFLIGGLMGAVGSVTRIEYHDGQTKRKALSMNPRVMLGSATSSALLCSLFWYMQQPSRQRREEMQQQEQQLQQAAAAAQAAAATGKAAPAKKLPLPPTIKPPAADRPPSELMTDGQSPSELETSPFPTTGFAQGLLPDGLLSGESPESLAPAEPAAVEPAAELVPPPPPEPASGSGWDASEPPAAGGEQPMNDGQLKDPWSAK